MGNQQQYEGGCLCGAVRFRAHGTPIAVAICHCRTCQKAAGAESVAWAQFSCAAITWSGTERSEYASSPGVKRAFCQSCGSSLSYQVEVDSLDLALACLDDPEALTPAKEIWLDHRRSWNQRNRNLPGYARFQSDGVEAT